VPTVLASGDDVCTSVDDRSENGVVIDRTAVPPSMSELPLTLGDRQSSTAPDAGHVIRVQLAELCLTRRQSSGAQTGRRHGRASKHVQLISATAPEVRAVHTQMPASNK